MKKIAFTVLFAILSLCATAQSAKNVLEIDQASFRPVQTGALTGVGIDKIGLDRSKRPCARIKLHINRMTREEINGLVVRPIGGMVELTKKSTAVEGNGIIFEITAKEQVRFYLHHDKYGDSNEVSLDLEGNKEYFLDAQLDLLLPITVVSNVKNADVYVDDVYKGRTGENYMLTIEDVVPGNHHIAIKYGVSTAEQTVEVNSGRVSFRIEINSQSSRPQYVIFELEPKTAMVFIDDEPQTTQEGFVTAVKGNGTYSYRVIAKGYYEQSGTFTVSGEKVTRKITLKADAAMVTISAGEGAEIWVNNELKGQSPWRGQLPSGTYIFEARKEGHRTTSLSQSIASTPAEQSYTLDAPTPIYGSVDISSVPAMADVYIDGKHVGQTPMISDLFEGNHAITIRKEGYKLFEQVASVVEGKTSIVVATLEKGTTPAMPNTTTSEYDYKSVWMPSNVSSQATNFNIPQSGSYTAGSTNVTTTPTTPATTTATPKPKTKSEWNTGVAVRGFGKKYGYKNKEGKLVLPYVYKKMWVSENYVWARKDKKSSWGVYDAEGKLLLPHEYSDVYTPGGLKKDGYICARQKKKSSWGIYNNDGVLKIPHIYRNFGIKYSEGLLAAQKGAKWGYIDEKGNTVIDFKYKGASIFSEGLAAVKRGRYGYIDKEGKVVMPFKFKTADPFHDGLARVGKQAGYGLWLTCLILGPYGVEIALLAMPTHIKYGYIDKTGGFVIPQSYKSAPVKFDSNGLARVSYQRFNKNSFYIDKRNNRYRTYEEALKALEIK